MRQPGNNFLATVAVLAAIAVAQARATPPQAAKPAPSQDQPLIEVDLHKFADANWDPNNSEKAGSTARSEIYFSDSRSLIWAWITRDNKSPLPKTTWHFHAILLDATTGQEMAKHEWPAPFGWGTQFVASNGKFLTCTDNKIRLFSDHFEALAEMEMPAHIDCRDAKFLDGSRASACRKSVHISHGFNQSRGVETLDTDTLKVISTYSEDKSVYLTDITDHWLAGTCGKPPQVCMRPTAGSWRNINFAEANNQTSALRPASVLLTDENTLVIRGMNQMTVVNTDGSVLFQSRLPKSRSYGWGALDESSVSCDGERFAVIEDRWRGLESDFLDIYKFLANDEIVVYSIAERRAIYTLKVKGSSPWPPFTNRKTVFAMSPDGSLLAVVTDGVLRIYKLPARQIAH